jgi:hypothetical protein
MNRPSRCRALFGAGARQRAEIEEALSIRHLGTDDRGAIRDRIARVLADAYGRGLLSSQTLSRRVEVLVGTAVVDVASLVEDLAIRVPSRGWQVRLGRVLGSSRTVRDLGADTRSGLLAVRWGGGDAELLVGRHPQCDIVLGDLTVSRHHARLVCRDGRWIVQDLDSTNGTAVNGVAVGRCELRCGDQLSLGDTVLWLA